MNLMASATTKEPINLDIRDGKLYCNQCGEVMNPNGAFFSTGWVFSILMGRSETERHNHNPSTSLMGLQCRNGHYMTVSKAHKCPKPGCAWSQVGERSFLHDGPKLEEWPE